MRHLAKSVWILPGWKKRRPFFLLSHTPDISAYQLNTRIIGTKRPPRQVVFFFLCVLCLFISTHFRARSVMVPGLGLAVPIRVGTDNPNQS